MVTPETIPNGKMSPLNKTAKHLKITLQTFIGLTTRVTQDAKGAGSESEPIPVWPWALLSSVTGIIQQHQCLHHSSLKYFIHFSVFWRGGGGERVYLQRSSFADRATPELILFFMIWREAYESVLGEGLCLLCLKLPLGEWCHQWERLCTTCKFWQRAPSRTLEALPACPKNTTHPLGGMKRNSRGGFWRLEPIRISNFLCASSLSPQSLHQAFPKKAHSGTICPWASLPNDGKSSQLAPVLCSYLTLLPKSLAFNRWHGNQASCDW